MTEPDAPVFVWIRGLRGPERQKWDSMRRDKYWEDKIISAHPITQAQFDCFTLDRLASMYPCRGAKL